MLQSENANDQVCDAQSVSAVRGGDVERYRELVERHERRVFAVAWSRLGDAALAEEATQEAFIRGYRRLWLLGDGAKFAGWITAIARRASINLGLRHRRELNKRARWALEQTDAPENSRNEPADTYTPEMLRQAMEELPAAHRECLVLFYLEGRSGAEAAAALGVSEAAFRVRLLRARAAVREKLERKLEKSLEKLRPAKSLVPAVMAAVLVSSSAKAATGGTVTAGTGAKVASLLGKTVLFSWFVPLIGVVSMLPGVGVAWIIGGMERRNFRDADGFRPELHRQFFRSFAWGFPFIGVLMLVILPFILTAWKINMNFFLSGFLLILTLISARSLTILRNQFQVGIFAYGVIIMVGLSALALGLIPPSLAQLPMLVATLLFLLIFKKRPTRMDYSLFLRAAEGLLKFPTSTDNAASVFRINRRSLLAFARFLGSRYLVSNFRWETRGLALRLPPVKTSFIAGMAGIFMPPITRGCPHILLGWDGTIEAHCGSKDAKDLSALMPHKCIDIAEIESVVAKGIDQAWRELREGKLTATERALGELPESEVFVVSPALAKSTRWWQLLLGLSVLLMVVAMIMMNWRPMWLSGLKPVSISEAEVLEFLSDIKTNASRNGVIEPPNSPIEALDTRLVFPSTNLFTMNSLREMHEKLFGETDFRPQGWEGWKVVSVVFNSSMLHRAIEAGWVDWKDLGLKPQDITEYLHRNEKYNERQFEWERFMSHGDSWSWVKEEKFPVKRIADYGLIELRWLRDVKCLDLVDREKLIQLIAPVQVLSGKAPPGQPPIHDWRDVRGLFFTPSWPVLEDTYVSVATLEILGGLNKIDREACVQGILRLHHGKGYFDSPDSGGYNEYKVDGAARDTFCAFESLRILGALDRVKDLDRWQFRVERSHERDSPPGLNWDKVEAWVCQQRLERILRERKANPKAPVRSLLEPD